MYNFYPGWGFRESGVPLTQISPKPSRAHECEEKELKSRTRKKEEETSREEGFVSSLWIYESEGKYVEWIRSEIGEAPRH